MKKIASLLLCAVLFIASAIPCFATTISEDALPAEENFSQNFHVSPVSPWDLPSPQGTDYPRNTWNVHTQGTYSFSGQASYSLLYLSYLIYGGDGYKVIVTNRSTSNTLTVNPHDSVPIAPFTVSPNTTTPEKKFMQKPGTSYFLLSFNAPSNFKGTVSENIYQ